MVLVRQQEDGKGMQEEIGNVDSLDDDDSTTQEEQEDHEGSGVERQRQ